MSRLIALATVAVAVAAALPAATALAQSQRVGREQTINRQVDAGGTVRVYTYSAFNSACEPRPAPQVVIRSAAAHGTVTTQPGTIRVGSVGETAADCFGREMPGVSLIYMAQAGFHGVDRFEYDVVYQNGRNRHDTAVIAVR